jgi:membrane associated rhomboid family serine protease
VYHLSGELARILQVAIQRAGLLEGRIRYLPFATIFFVFLNLALFIESLSTDLISRYGFPTISSLNPDLETMVKSFSYMFIHADPIHLSINLVGLVYFGALAERIIGWFRWIAVYITAGVLSAFIFGSVALVMLGNELLIGSSGAIAGLVGVVVAFGINRAYYWLIAEGALALVGYLISIPIASAAHLGGFAMGLLIGKLMLPSSKRIRQEKMAANSSNISQPLAKPQH